MKIKSMASKHKVGKKKKTQSGGQVSEKKKTVDRWECVWTEMTTSLKQVDIIMKQHI